MRRTLLIMLTLLLTSLPGPAVAQSPAPSGPPAFEMAPGVTVQALAFLPGQSDPVVFRLNFQPGAGTDLTAIPSVGLATIESGSIAVETTVDITVYSGSGTSGTMAPAGTAHTMQAGDYFLVAPGAPGHVSNAGSSVASMLVAKLPVAGAAASAGPSASPAPVASGSPQG